MPFLLCVTPKASWDHLPLPAVTLVWHRHPQDPLNSDQLSNKEGHSSLLQELPGTCWC